MLTERKREKRDISELLQLLSKTSRFLRMIRNCSFHVDRIYGPDFYPIGAVGPRGERLDIARQRGIGLHDGRDSYRHPTHGCIRMNSGDISDLHNKTQNAPLQVITIGD